MVKPLLSDIEFSQRFNAGDRILCRVSVDLTPIQQSRIRKAVQRATRADVRVLIVNCMRMAMLRIRDEKTETLVGPDDLHTAPVAPGQVHINCAVVDLNSNDGVVVLMSGDIREDVRRHAMSAIKEWVGHDVTLSTTKFVGDIASLGLSGD